MDFWSLSSPGLLGAVGGVAASSMSVGLGPDPMTMGIGMPVGLGLGWASFYVLDRYLLPAGYNYWMGAAATAAVVYWYGSRKDSKMFAWFMFGF